VSADSGSPRTDAAYDFARARRHQAAAKLLARLRREDPLALSYEDVIAAAGYVSERDLGQQVVALDTIVGSVDRPRDFDRAFRPTSTRTRARWERISAAYRSGQELPPIKVRRIGDWHFVVDGHHRVSVARQLRLDTIDAFVTEVQTRVPPASEDFALKMHERLFAERVPLPQEALDRIDLDDEERYAALAEGVEAWGFRLMQAENRFIGRAEVARRWYEEIYLPEVKLLHEANLIGRAGEAEAFIRLETMRYMLLRSHAPVDDATLERLRDSL
jgi:hypothetical protein